MYVLILVQTTILVVLFSSRQWNERRSSVLYCSYCFDICPSHFTPTGFFGGHCGLCCVPKVCQGCGIPSFITQTRGGDQIPRAVSINGTVNTKYHSRLGLKYCVNKFLTSRFHWAPPGQPQTDPCQPRQALSTQYIFAHCILFLSSKLKESSINSDFPEACTTRSTGTGNAWCRWERDVNWHE